MSSCAVIIELKKYKIISFDVLISMYYFTKNLQWYVHNVCSFAQKRGRHPSGPTDLLNTNFSSAWSKPSYQFFKLVTGVPWYPTSNAGNFLGGSLTNTEAKIYSIDLPFLSHNVLYVHFCLSNLKL